MRRRENRPFPVSSQDFVPSWKRNPTQSQSRIADSLVQGARKRSLSSFTSKQEPYHLATQWGPSRNEAHGHYVDTDDFQLDAFDLELLAQSDKQSRGFPGSPYPEGFSSYHLRQPEPSGQVSRFFAASQTTPHRSLASSSSDVDIRDASSPLARLQTGRATLPRDWEKEAQRTNQGSYSYTAGSDNSHTTPNALASTPFQQIPNASHSIKLVSTRELPDNHRSLFHFPCFNAVQSKCFQTIYKGDDNVVLAAPTGSGKTVVMELAICRLLNSLKDEQFKVVYQAPTKSLCSERFQDWSRKFNSLGLQCSELTGDTDHLQLRNVQNSRIIITTPEKWDSMTRKWKDHARLMQLVKLFLIDEVHTLKEARGATLEAVVSRMKSFGSNVRFVALSATIPNSEDIATWLGRNATNQHVPAHREHFGEEFRPVKLQKVVYGYQASGNDFAFDKLCNSKLASIISTHGARKPIMIFCCTRNSAMSTAKELTRLWSTSNSPARLWTGPSRPLGVSHTDLKVTTAAGVAFHHAGLELSDRHQVESGFLDRKISVICCTSTLAVGVNLPCHLVIIKGTVGWQDGHCQEYSDLEVMQMLGRSGRPQFDDSATAVILTRKERVKHYERLVSGSESLESCLHLNLVDHLNAEIGLGNVTSVESAIGWLASTFLFVRLRRNPTHYRLKEGANQDDENEMLRQICEKDIKLLQECGLVTMEGLKATPFGDAMARYYVRFETMKIFLTLKPRSDIEQILSVISQAEEFREVRLKSGEKGVYKEINRSTDIKFPINVDIALPAHKTSLIIQAELGAADFPTTEQLQKHKFPFQQDKNFVFTHVNRLIRCIIDCQVHLQDSVTVLNALELARSLTAKVWDNSPLQMKQIDQIGIVAVRKLAAAGIESIEDLEDAEPHRIDMALSKNPPFGVKLRNRLVDFPKLRVTLKMMGKDIKPGREVRIKFKAEVAFMNERCPTFFQRRPVYVCFTAEASDGRLVDFRRMSASKLEKTLDVLLSAELMCQDQYISCHVMCDEIAGTARSAILKVDLPPSYFPRQPLGARAVQGTELVDATANEGDSQVKPHGKTRIHRFDSDERLLGEFLSSEIFDDWNDVGFIGNPEAQSTMSRTNSSGNERVKPSATVKGNLDNLNKGDSMAHPSGPKKTVTRSNSTRNECAKPSVIAESISVLSHEPSKLENGRWACNHKCKDKSACKHLCCREGLDNPPKAGRKKSDVSALEPAGSNQLTLSSSVVKRAHQPRFSEATKRSKAGKKNDRINANLEKIPELQALRASDVPPLSPIVDSSDYGDESFDDLPSPEELLFQNVPGLAIASGKVLGASEPVESVNELGDNWVDADDALFPVRPSPTQQPLRGNSDIVDLVTPEPQEMSPMVPASDPCGGAKRKNSGVEICGACSEENKRAKTSEIPESLTNKVIETELQPAPEELHIPLDWDDVGRDIMEEFKDYVFI